MSQILIAEDEERITSFIQKGLRGHGFATVTATDGVSALDLAQSDMVDLVILDIGLPRLDGFEVLRRLRATGSTIPVIILTARGTIPDKLTGLGGGADDYMVKPFSFDELLARIRLRLRDTTNAPAGSVLACGGLTLDLDTRLATVDGERVELSAREFSLATVLLHNPGRVLTREQLLDRVWGFDFDPGSNVVDVYIRYLRNKIGAARIETVRGMGYRLIDT
jgi:DNA-binding response OmpR family regulator